MTAEFFCTTCDEPIVGAVTGSRCVNCLMGYDPDEYICDICGEECDPGTGTPYCNSCQEMLDVGVGEVEEDWLNPEERTDHD